MLDPDITVHIFSRNSDRGPFIYLGLGQAVDKSNSTPVMIKWKLTDPNEGEALGVTYTEGFTLPDEVEKYWEGASKQVVVNAYERNHQARQQCIEHYGSDCAVCGFNFQTVYGSIGAGYIHVHHVKPISQVTAEYEIDPIADLRPVCPNCHSMLHKRMPEPFTIAELQSQMR